MAKSTKPKFENRIRFNWGYHDAAQAVREGWATPERNFGFGPALTVTKPEDVLTQHFDKEYARGWQYGYVAAKGGFYFGDSTNSWEQAVLAGEVTE